MKNKIGIVGYSDISKSTTTRIVEEIMKQEKTVLVVGSVENNPPQPTFPIVPYPQLPEPYIVNYGNKMSNRAARRKKERDSKKRK